jgi:hypothetical protein
MIKKLKIQGQSSVFAADLLGAFKRLRAQCGSNMAGMGDGSFRNAHLILLGQINKPPQMH